MNPVTDPSWRKPVGVFAIIAWLVVYALLVATMADTLNALPTILMVPAYLVFGLAWVLPLKPLFLWMNTGLWRVPEE
ncbi:MAG: DUF2842 domain-containing protein [Polymorphobacter sp.]|uniref:DUF2842 domain-containing protein n=1 Tax=Polymorphobacter sp. TaxID=1909290 RepID=UPI003A8B8A89